MQKILVIDDDRDMCLLLKRFLTSRGYIVCVAYNSKQAIELLELTEPQLVLCDFRLDNNDGKTMLLRIKEIYPLLPVIIITGYSDIRIAVEVMKLGAFDYVTKPIFPDEILATIHPALNDTGKAGLMGSHHNGVQHNGTAADENRSIYIFHGSQTLENISEQIHTIAQQEANVIIYGESGIGKQVIAEEIHGRSRRSKKPFVPVNCGALSKELGTREITGYEKGAFAGALHQKTGYLDKANGGTLFLDDITKLSPEVQLCLVRAIQERKFRRLGGVKDIAFNACLVASSRESIEEASNKGTFSGALFQALRQFTIVVPPLRERKEDILLFAHHFLQLTNTYINKNIGGFSAEVEEILKSYIWYGNLRELKNIVKRASLLCDEEYIQARFLPFEISNFRKLLFEETPADAVATEIDTPMIAVSIPKTLLHETTLKEVSIDAEYEVILGALKQNNFNKSRAARSLNIDRKTLYNKNETVPAVKQSLVYGNVRAQRHF